MLTVNQGIVGEARIEHRVFDDEHVVGQDRVVAERDLARGAILTQSAFGLEPLPVLLDERDEGDRHGEEFAGEAADGVELRLGLGTEDVELAQGGEPFRLVRRYRKHRASPA